MGSVGQRAVTDYQMVDTAHEDADLRAHVGVHARTVYVFPPEHALRVGKEHGLQLVNAYQTNVEGPTATGFRVPLDLLRPYLWSAFVPDWSGWAGFDRTLPTSEKGRRAQALVVELLCNGRFPMPTKPEIVTDRQRQIAGIDLVVNVLWKIQVKCDYRAGANGCGIYFQLSERNPLRCI